MGILNDLVDSIKNSAKPATIEELKQKAESLEKKATDMEERAKYKKKIKDAQARINKVKNGGY